MITQKYVTTHTMTMCQTWIMYKLIEIALAGMAVHSFLSHWGCLEPTSHRLHNFIINNNIINNNIIHNNVVNNIIIKSMLPAYRLLC